MNYTQDGIDFKREIFTSYPDQVMVAKFTANQKKKISFKVTMNRPERFKTYAKNNQLIMSGILSNGKGGDGLQYMTRLKASHKNGTLKYIGDQLIVENADEVILYLSASTDYVLQYPNYNGRDYVNITKQNIEKAFSKDYKDLLHSHIKEYQNYFKRVEFDITPNKISCNTYR